MTIAERLLAAADRLDKVASDATEGVWAYELLPERWDGDRPAHWVRFDHADDDGGSTSGTIAECPWGARDARYIATMHPEVGKVVAAWLRAEGDALADPLNLIATDGLVDRRALTIADLVLAKP